MFGHTKTLKEAIEKGPMVTCFTTSKLACTSRSPHTLLKRELFESCCSTGTAENQMEENMGLSF